MSNVLDTDALIRSIKRRAMIPENQSTFSEADLLEMINEEVQVGILPHVIQVHEEYYVHHADFLIEDGKNRYPIPSRAVGAKLREVSIIDNNFNIYEISRVSVEDLSDYDGLNRTSYYRIFYVENNDIVLPGNSFGPDGSVRMHFYLRPNSMVKSNRAGIIDQITPNSVTGITTIQVKKFRDHFTTDIDYDFISAGSPNKSLAFDISIPALDDLGAPVTGVDDANLSLNFKTSDLPDNLKVGDYVMQSGEAIVPQMPSELHPILAQRVAVQCLEALGDLQGKASAQERLDRMERNSLKLIDNRVEGAPQKINPRNNILKEQVYGSRIKRSRYRR